jgi:hypothetical protein
LRGRALPAAPAVSDSTPQVRERSVPVTLSLDPAGVSDAMFGAVQRPGERNTGTLTLAAVAGAFAIVGAVLLFSSGSAEEASTPSRVVARADKSSLELLSLNHAGTEGEWRIAGAVRNPGASAALGTVTAVAFLFDKDGAFVGSGRAPLESMEFGIGDTSSFTVAVAPTGPVARYRISFRGADGQVIPHVDRRPNPPQQARQ